MVRSLLYLFLDLYNIQGHAFFQYDFFIKSYIYFFTLYSKTVVLYYYAKKYDYKFEFYRELAILEMT